MLFCKCTTVSPDSPRGVSEQDRQQSSSRYTSSVAGLPRTRLVRLSRPRAAALLLLTLVVIGLGLRNLGPATAFTEGPRLPGEETDLDLYAAVVARIQHGEDYYDVLGDELRSRGYAARSVFNWRTPLHLWVLGHLPHMLIGKAVLAMLAALSGLLAWPTVLRTGGTATAVVALQFMLGSLLLCVLGNLYLFAEVWAGTLMITSALLLARGHWRSAVALGLLAALFREFAILYLVVALASAIFRRRPLEAVAWTGAVVVWLAYLGLHALAVQSRILPTDLAVRGGGSSSAGCRWSSRRGDRTLSSNSFPPGFRPSTCRWRCSGCAPGRTLGPSRCS